MAQTTMISKNEMIQQISDADWKVAQQAEEVKRLGMIIHDEIEAHTETENIKRLKEDLDAAIERRRIGLMENSIYNNAMTELHDAKRELEARRDTLSALLFTYSVDYRVKSFADDGENRIINVKAKLGKKLAETAELTF